LYWLGTCCKANHKKCSETTSTTVTRKVSRMPAKDEQSVSSIGDKKHENNK
jgi:hypothetical protein